MTAVESHYGDGGVLERVRAALAAAGIADAVVDPDDLPRLDEFHVGGREATMLLAEAAGIREGEDVLDVGAGFAGPARRLAKHFGARVTALDLTEEYVRAAELLNERSGMGGLIRVVRGDALDLPFPDASFDVGWTQHTQMNIADKARFVGELARVLRPGGRFAAWDIVAGDGGPPHYPLPWADDPSISFLAAADELRAHVEAAGLRVELWHDGSEEALGFGRRLMELPPPQFEYVPGIRARLPNVVRSLEEGRLRVLRIVARA